MVKSSPTLALGVLFTLCLVSAQAPPGFDFESTCTSLASTLSGSIPNTTVFFSSLIPAGSSITFPDTDPSCQAPGSSQIVPVDTCRVTMAVSTSDQGSGIQMETWLPRNWTGRFLSTGNGGEAGCIQYGDMAYGSTLGFATVGANGGHNGTSGRAFLNHPEVLKDFVSRSIHTNVVVGKQVTEMFYGVPHTKSYYLGCSTGGRQGLKSVQDFPDDFDGVIAGAAAADYNHLQGRNGNFFLITGPSNASTFLSVSQWVNIVHPDVLKQCDGIDKVLDGIVEDPALCDYDPSGLICEGNSTVNCISEAQAETIRKVFSPFFIKGQFAFPRVEPGTESLPQLFASGTIFGLTANWFRFVVFSDPNFDVNTLGPDDWELAQELDPFNVSTFNGDISTFKNRDGKLITYHGQADQLIAPGNTPRYYEHVLRTMGLDFGQMDEFYRSFRISGMGHCSGGVGAWEIGQTLGAVAGSVLPGGDGLSPDRNVLMAMVRWVEEGVAPDTILGAKFVNDDPDEGVQFSRRHCRLPMRNTFVGGNSTLPESWSCR